MRAAIYVRISEDRLGLEAGVTRQEEDCRALAQRLDCDLVPDEAAGLDIFCDNDLSASKRGVTRPAFERLLKLVRSGEVEAIICWRIDRLYRRPIELEGLLELIEYEKRLPGGVRTEKTGDFDLNNSAGRHYARGAINNAKYESEQTSERVSRAMLQSAQNGRRRGGRRGVGYEADMTVNVEEAERLQQAAADLLGGGSSLTSIAVRWNEEGFTTPRGNLWDGTTLKDALTKAEVAGLRAHGGETFPGSWEPIIDEATWHRLRGLLSDPRRATISGNGARGFLSGMVYCGSCGHRMVQKRRRDGEPLYACESSKLDRQAGRCGSVSGVRSHVEYRVEEELAKVADMDFARILEAQADDSDVKELLAEQESIEQRAEAIGVELAEASSDVRRRALGKALDRLEAEDAAVRRRLAAASGRPAPLNVEELRSRLAEWESLTTEEQRAATECIVEKVVLLPHSGTTGGNVRDLDAIRARYRERVRVDFHPA